MSRTGQFIYLRTRGFLDVDEKTRQVHSFVCINTLMTEEEGRQLIKEMKKKFSAIISEAELSALESDIPAVENPNNLEHAILNLITNLNNQAMCVDDDPSMSDSSSNNIEAVDKKLPLAIIPPEPDTIKSSITKAVEVMSHTVKLSNCTRIKEEPKSPESLSGHLTDVATSKNNFKMEPLSNVMSSPSSASPMSSNDPLSPFSCSSSSSSSTTTTTCIPPTNTAKHSTSNDFKNTSNDGNHQHKQSKLQSTSSLHEAAGTISVITSTGDSTIPTNNNNKNNSNRNSVLKRTRSRDDCDYTETSIKKRVVVDASNFIEPQSLDIIESADTGLFMIIFFYENIHSTVNQKLKF